MERIRIGDEVIVTGGNHKGKVGKVLSIVKKGKKIARTGHRVLVEGVTGKKHVKPNPNIGQEGAIKDINIPIHISNIMHHNPATGKGERIGVKEVDGRNVRYFKSNNEVIDVVS